MDVRGCFLRFVLASLAVLAVAALVASGASAEARLVKAWPPPDGLVGASARAVNIVFGEPLNPIGSTLSVTRVVGDERVDAGDARPDASASQVLTASLRPNLPAGKYRVDWTAVSAKDGSVARGDYLFTITPFLKAEPPPGGEIKGSPQAVTVTFGEPLPFKGSGLVVSDEAGARVDLGDSWFDPADPGGRTLRISLPAELKPGKYVVKWTAALKDGLALDSYGFTVHAFAPGPPCPAPATLPATGEPVPAWPLALLGGTLAAAGLALRKGWWA